MRAGQAIGAAALIMATGLLAGCSEGGLAGRLRSSGVGSTPDEFLVLPTKPLEIPENLAALPPPRPGAPNRVDPRAGGRRRGGADGAAGAPPGRRPGGTLIARAGPVDPQIRSRLASEDVVYRDENQGLLLERLTDNSPDWIDLRGHAAQLRRRVRAAARAGPARARGAAAGLLTRAPGGRAPRQLTVAPTPAGHATCRGMNAESPKIEAERRPIRLLDAAAANRIAAGEVVERPASAVKELVENALDAGARRIDIAYADGGKRLIRVADDGCGIPVGELALALSRHATSKLDGDDLVNIRELRLSRRGAALAGRGRAADRDVAGARGRPRRRRSPCAAATRGRCGRRRARAGTLVEVEGLFSATPARLKFLRTDRAEAHGDRARSCAGSRSPRRSVGFTLRDVGDPGRAARDPAPRRRAGRSVRRAARAAARGARGRVRRERAADRRGPRRAAAVRLRGAADLFARGGGGAALPRERAAGARPAAARGAARGLCRRAAARPPSRRRCSRSAARPTRST